MKVSINDKEYSLCWGTDALDRYCVKVNKLDDLFGALALAFPSTDDDGNFTTPGVTFLSMAKARIKFLYSALESGAEVLDGKDALDLTLAQFTHWVDSIPTSEMVAILDDWKKSKWQGATVEEYLFNTETRSDAPKKKSPAAK